MSDEPDEREFDEDAGFDVTLGGETDGDSGTDPDAADAIPSPPSASAIRSCSARSSQSTISEEMSGFDRTSRSVVFNRTCTSSRGVSAASTASAMDASNASRSATSTSTYSASFES